MGRSVNYTVSLLVLVGLSFKLELGHGDALGCGVVVLVVEAVFVERELLHLQVVVGADSVNVGSGSDFLEQLLGVVEVEHFLDAIEVVTHVVPVFLDLKGAMNLVLVHFLIFY